MFGSYLEMFTFQQTHNLINSVFLNVFTLYNKKNYYLFIARGKHNIGREEKRLISTADCVYKLIKK